MFQFQYGAIGRPGGEIMPLTEKVSIPVWCDWEQHLNDWRNQMTQFQFQYGAIGSNNTTNPYIWSIRFNSSMVRLGVNRQHCYTVIISIVSIPVWCDWEHKLFSFCLIFMPFQFQYGAIGRNIGWEYSLIGICFNSSMVRLGAYSRSKNNI